MSTVPGSEPMPTPDAFGRFRQWRTLVPIAFTIFVLSAGFAAGIRSGLRDTTSHLFIDLSAMTAALSSKYHGLSGHPYQGFLSVRSALEKEGLLVNKENFPGNFRNYAILTGALHAAETTPTCGSPLVSDAFNDQGVFDYFRGSFALFGADARSTYYFYFLLIGSSALIYLLCFWRSYAACTLLLSCAAAIYSFMPGYVLNNSQLISVSNSRFLSTLGIIPLLHLLMTLIRARGPRIGWISLIAIIAQSAIVELAIAARATAQWMEIAFVIVVTVFLIRVAFSTYWEGNFGAFRLFLIGRGATALYVVATLLVLGSLRALSLPPSCGAAINGHPFWHNMFIGLTFNPEWATKIRPEIGLSDETIVGDQMVFAVAGLYAERHHLPFQTKPNIWIPARGNGVDLAPFGSWQTYENIVRNAFFEFVYHHRLYTFKTFMVYKPELLWYHIHNFLVEAIHELSPFGLITLIIMIVAIGLFCPTNERELGDAGWQIGKLLLLTAFCGAISAIPLLLAYPDDFLIADQAYLALAVIVVSAIWVIALGRLLTHRLRSAD